MQTLISTMMIGEVPYASKTLPIIEAYADRIGAELSIISSTSPPFLRRFTCNKFQAIQKFLEGPYQQLLLLDLDVIISPNAPNIFEDHRDGLWAAPAISTGMISQYLRGIERINGHIPPDLDASSYPNAGVMVFDRKTAGALMPSLLPPYGPWTEQGVLHWATYKHGITVQKLPYQWNCLMGRLAQTEFPHILHIAGAKGNGRFEKRFQKACSLNKEVSSWGLDW